MLLHSLGDWNMLELEWKHMKHLKYEPLKLVYY